MHLWRFWVALPLLVALGCGVPEEEVTSPSSGGSSEARDTSSSDAGSTATKTYSLSELPKLEAPLPPRQDKRLNNLAAPEGWRRMPRATDYVAMFNTQGKELPRILLKATDAPAGWPDKVTADNVSELHALISEELANTKLLERPRPLVIGNNAYVRYVTPARKGPRSVERQILETSFDGRRYTFILEVWEGDITKFNHAAYAVAGGVEFVPASEDAPMLPMADEPPAESSETGEKSETSE